MSPFVPSELSSRARAACVFERHVLRRGWIVGLLSLVLLTGAPARAADRPTAAMPTLSFQRAVPLRTGDGPIDLEFHATTRCFDWDGDGDADLLVGGGDGRLWLFRRTNPSGGSTWAAKEPITAGSRDRWGETYTGVVLVDLMGDALSDLVVAHSGNQLTVHENQGDPGRPRFAESGSSFQLPDDCQGRFDVADWDGDGLLDVIAGGFGGKVLWHRNVGSKRQPRFAAGQPLADIARPYNAHPRVLDFNQDGLLDLVLGVNWGTVTVFLNEGSQGEPRLARGRQLRWSDDGRTLSIRDLNGDDTTPELIDLDRDGVLDLVSGGKNGRLFLMKGVGSLSRVAVFEKLLESHARNFGDVLRRDESVRGEAFGALRPVQADLEGGLLPAPARKQLFQQLAALVDRYPRYLRHRQFDVERTPELPLLAAQFHVALLESLPDSGEQRTRVAELLQLSAGHRRLLIDLGVLLVDNGQATPEHLAAMHALMTSMPRNVWDVETITVADWLGPAARRDRLVSRSGINIFGLPLGRPENSFPADAPRPGETDVFLICLAHELAHNMLDTVGRSIRPELYERKFECLDEAAGPLVVYQSPKSRGIDWKSTKKNFQDAGAWDGDEKRWSEAWAGYFRGKEPFDRAYLRGNIHFFLNAPQEAFATLANQYFTDSRLMLELCKVRWDAGYRMNVHQFLLIAEYLSQGKDRVTFYVMRPGGRLTTESARLVRDGRGRIVKLDVPRATARFTYGEGDQVTEFDLARSEP